jgi:hypothetical protein
MSEIVQAIRQMVKPLINNDLMLGEVKEFDSSNWTITVELHQGGRVKKVTVRSVLNSEKTGIFVEPKVGSYVLCGRTDGKLENLSVIVFSEIVNMELMPEEDFKIQAKKIQLLASDEDFGGLVKLQELEDNLNALKDYCEAMKSAVSTGLNGVGASPAASGSAGAGAFEGAMAGQQIIFKNMENENVTHG